MKPLVFLTSLLIATLAHAEGVTSFAVGTYQPGEANTFGVLLVSQVPLLDEHIVITGPKDKIRIYDTECDPSGWKLIYSHDSLPAGKSELVIQLVMNHGYNQVYYFGETNLHWLDEPSFLYMGGDGIDHVLTGNRPDLIYLGAGDDICMSQGGVDTIQIGSGSDDIMSGAGVDKIYESNDGTGDVDKLNQGGQPDNVENAVIEELRNPG